MKFASGAIAIFALVASPIAAQSADTPVFTAERVEATVRFLADDLFEGRDTGSVGHEITARYVASRFAELGLKPAGDEGGYFQRITLQQTNPGATPGTVTISGPGGAEASWKHATEVLVGLSPNEPSLDIAAPMVFVGYGIENKLGINDYAGLDVKGKVVVALRGFPKGMPSEEAAHLGATKRQAAQAHGAIAMVSIGTLLSNKTRPWQRSVQFADEPDFAWVGADGKAFDEAPKIRVTASLNDPAARAAFAGAPQTLDAIRAVADSDGGRPRGFNLKTRIRIQNESVTKRVTSPNVVAILPGSDPKLRDEYVVLSAHLDHIGLVAAKPGDKPGVDLINNGALDNAAGVATMLEVARASATAASRPRRSLIFIATTGEEKGLIGADYYARHPSVPIASIVGNVDLDMPLLLYRFTDVTAFGADHSTLGPIVAKAIEPMGLTLSPDPMPQESIFVRSDHYMFVKQGVPAVFLATGFGNGGDKHWGKFLSGAYHHPDDDMNQKIDWKSGARFAEANYRIMRAMADADTPPLWYAGDFFGDTFAPKARKAARP
ncbi:M28 family metallopeptidase [Sphingomonas sp. SRS2]|uniref:M28 family metallopeptidase n=1 Tax=Sphingomonas sp. SRS2 TaxID=133190 RepID=UPI000618488B|nr:M28 family metallopeptidase [Sphingomonas sp. SRS2]KKC24431.1 peptidase M28 [Sphingomonas sp. SRS2]